MALATFSDEPAALLTAARRLLTRQPALAPLWWMASRMILAEDPRREARLVVETLRTDTTARELAHNLPASAVVAIVGAPELILEAVERRGDVTVLVIDVDGLGAPVVRRLDRAGVMAESVEGYRIGGVVDEAHLVLIDAVALGPTACLVEPGATPLAATARTLGRPVWVVAGPGRAVPEPYWQQIVARTFEADRSLEAWLQPWEVLSHGLTDRLVSAAGVQLPGEIGANEMAVAPELLVPLPR